MKAVRPLPHLFEESENKACRRWVAFSNVSPNDCLETMPDSIRNLLTIDDFKPTSMKLRQFSISTFLLSALLLISSCASHNQMPNRPFEGTITQTIHAQGLMDMLGGAMDSGKGSSLPPGRPNVPGAGLMGLLSNVSVKIYVRPDKVAYDVDAVGGLLHVRSIIDRNTRTITTLMNNQALVANLRSFDSIRPKIDSSINANPQLKDTLQNNLPQATGKHAVINGFEADEYRAKSNGLDVQVWLTDDPRMKFYEVIRDAFLGRNTTGTGGLEELFSILAPISGGKVPVKSVISMNGKQVISSELGSINEEKVDDDIFQIPKDYEIVKSDSLKSMRKMHQVVDTTDVQD